MATNKKVKKYKHEKDIVYKGFEWVIDKLDFSAILWIMGLLAMSFFLFGNFWLGCDLNEAGNPICVNSINWSFWAAYVVCFLLVTELIFIWLCKNKKDLNEEDTISIKVFSLIFGDLIINLVIPGSYYIIKYTFMYFATILLYGLITAGIVLLLRLFYIINSSILLHIKDSRVKNKK